MTPRSRLLLFVVLFAGVALAISLFIICKVSAHQALPGCGEGRCNDVLSSHWEQWGPLPVAFLGVGGYMALMVGALVLSLPGLRSLDKTVWSLMSVEAVVGLGFIAWLMILQWLVIRHFCMFCLSSHLFGVLSYALVLRATPMWRAGPYARIWVGGGATTLLAFMIGVHILFIPDISVVQAAEEVAWDSYYAKPVSGGGVIQFGQPKVLSRAVNLLNNTLTFDLYKVPVEGPRDAEHVILELSDYNCPSCRKLHHKLKEYKADTGVSLAIVCLPVPFNSTVNPNVKQTPKGFEESPTYARYSMAVQKADPDQFSEYHDFLMTGRWAPPLEEARARAESMVGKAAFEAALSAPEVEQWIATGINAHHYVQAKTLPRLISKDQVISYSGGSKAAFRIMMDKMLGIEK